MDDRDEPVFSQPPRSVEFVEAWKPKDPSPVMFDHGAPRLLHLEARSR